MKTGFKIQTYLLYLNFFLYTGLIELIFNKCCSCDMVIGCISLMVSLKSNLKPSTKMK